MRLYLSISMRCAAIAAVALLVASPAMAANVTIDRTLPWQGFMNVSELPENGGGFVFGSGWGVNDLVAEFTPPILELSPNTIGDPNEFWYQDPTNSGNTNPGGPGAPGNKVMDANLFVQDNSLAGQEVTFSGEVLSNTLVDPYTSVAFIRDFAPDFSSVNEITVPLTPGPFSITLQTTMGDPTRNIQFGFQTVGPNVWVTDVDPFGSVQLATVPEPLTLGLAAPLFAAAALRRRR